MRKKKEVHKRLLKIMIYLMILTVNSVILCACQNKASDTDRNTKTNKKIQKASETVAESKTSRDGNFEINHIDSKETGKTYSQTIMIYMIGSDLESESASASLDLVEMMESKTDTTENNVLVYTGGAKKWWLDESLNNKNTILKLEGDSFAVLESEQEKNMGDAETLSEFINYGLENYQTDKYSLILWDHGGGPVLGYGIDELSEDILDLAELKQALEDSVGKNSKKLEWIGFDACIMNSMETAVVLSDYAGYMIASQETEPGWGWDYSFLSALSEKDMDGERLGAEIIDTYYEYSQNMFEEDPKYFADVMLSCIELDKIEELEQEFNDFFEKQNDSLSKKTFAAVTRKHNQVKEFASFSTMGGYGMFDLQNFVKALDEKKANSVIGKTSETVVYMRSNIQNANGISICFPYNSEEIYIESAVALNKQFGFSKNYTNYLKKFCEIKNGESISDSNTWDLSKAETFVGQITGNDNTIESGSDITLKLSKQQQRNFSYAEFIIIKKIEVSKGTAYSNVHHGVRTKLDKKGVLHAYFGDEVIYITEKGSEDEYIIPLVEDNSSNKTEQRYTVKASLSSGEFFADNRKTVVAKLQIVLNDQYPNGTIRRAVRMSESGIQMPDKQLVDVDDYNYILILDNGCKARLETRDDSGILMPFEEWEDSGTYTGIDLFIDNGLELRAHPIENPQDYFCMFYIYDTQGNCTVSDMLPLE